MWSWETFLSNFPTVLTIWSALTVSWGVFSTIAYYKLVCHTPEYDCTCDQKCYHANVGAMIAANLFIFSYLILGSHVSHAIGDAITVVNIFYTMYLIPLNVCIYKAWRCKLEAFQESEEQSKLS